MTVGCLLTCVKYIGECCLFPIKKSPPHLALIWLYNRVGLVCINQSMLQISEEDVKSLKVWEWMCLGFWFDFSKQKSSSETWVSDCLVIQRCYEPALFSILAMLLPYENGFLSFLLTCQTVIKAPSKIPLFLFFFLRSPKHRKKGKHRN